MSVEHLWNDTDRGKSKNWDKIKRFPMLLCPPEIRRGLQVGSNPELLMDVVSVTQNV
jgi:hypothetical protein